MIEALGCFGVLLAMGVVVATLALVAWVVKAVFSLALWPLALAAGIVKAVLLLVAGVVVAALVVGVGLPLILGALVLALPLLIVAAVVAGCRQSRLLLRHLLPQLVPVLAVAAVLDFGSVMLAEAGISFLGFGVQPPDSSWGRMVAEGQTFVTTGAWWLFATPGLAIFITILSYNLAGEALRDASDPRLRGSR